MAKRLRSPVRRRMISLSLIVVVGLLVSGVLWVYHGAHGYYTLSPGTAPTVSADPSCRSVGGGSYALPGGKPCVRLVLPAGKSHPVAGSVMMVDVLVGPTTPGDYLLSKLGLLHTFRDGTVLVPSGAILGDTPAAQLVCQDDQAMVDSTSSAAVVAVRRLGYSVSQNDLGARVDQVQPGTPASKAGIQCNDLVTQIDGVAVHTATDLVTQIRAKAPGDRVELTVQRSGPGGKTKPMVLTATLGGTPASGTSAANPNKAFLGVATETRTTYQFPYNVNVDVGQIGGPSAGLALTLGLLDALSNGQLTGGHRIAATGTIDLEGNVGDVGGVAQKAVAVRRAGAQIFLVPPQELKAARSEAGSMKVYAVSTLQQALDYLKSFGGHVPPAISGNRASG